MEAIKYAIYPSLLDAYLRLKRHDDQETFQSLMDKINKVPTEQTEAQLKGIEFEALVNARIDGKAIEPADDHRYYQSEHFQFPVALIEPIASRLQFASKKQEYLEAIIDTRVGKIKLYGIADFSYPEMIVDLKGTSNYKYGKYSDHTQHPVYSLIKQVQGHPIKAFKYVASDFEKMFIETYIPSENMHYKLMLLIYEFINFIEYFKEHITDDKIFGGQSEKKAA